MLIVWSYNLENIIPTCQDFEEKLIKLVWNHRSANVSIASIAALSSNSSSEAHLAEKPKEEVQTKENPADRSQTVRSKGKKKRSWGLSYFVTDKEDVEKTAEGPSPRPVRLLAPMYNGLGVAMSICE